MKNSKDSNNNKEHNYLSTFQNNNNNNNLNLSTTNPNVKNAAKIETVDDPYYGSQIAVYAADTSLRIARMYPTSYDVLYQNPLYFYSNGSGTYGSEKIPFATMK